MDFPSRQDPADPLSSPSSLDDLGAKHRCLWALFGAEVVGKTCSCSQLCVDDVLLKIPSLEKMEASVPPRMDDGFPHACVCRPSPLVLPCLNSL